MMASRISEVLDLQWIPVRMWRIGRAEPEGLHVWFDPRTEVPLLLRIGCLDDDGTPEGDEGVTPEGDDVENDARHGEQLLMEGVLEGEDPLPF